MGWWQDVRNKGQEQQGGAQYIGGDPSQGRWNTAPPAGGEPPKSPSGHNWYTDEELAAWDAAGRPPNHDYLNQGGGGSWGRGQGFGR